MSLLGRKCPNCGARMPERSRFCGECGYDTGADYAEGIDSLRMALENEVTHRTDREDTGEIPSPTETSRWPAGEKKRSPVGVISLLAAIVMTVAVGALAVTLIQDMSTPRLPEAAEPTESVHTVSMDENKPHSLPTATPGPAAKPSVTPAGETVYAVTGANLRSGPGTEYGIVDSVEKDTALTRIGSEDGWSHLLYNGRECYAKDSLLTAEPPEGVTPPDEEETEQTTPDPDSTERPSGTLTVVSDVNVRSGPGTEYEKLGVAYAGEALTFTDYVDGWYLVIFEDGEGYVARNLVQADG